MTHKKASSQTDDVQLFSEGALHEDRRADGKSEISLVIMAKLWLPHLNGARTSFEWLESILVSTASVI